MDFMTVANQMLSLFIIMIIGYVMYRVKIIDDAATVRYTRLVLNISLPAQIITSFVENRGVVSNGVVLAVFGISFLVYVISALVGVLFIFVTRAPKEERGTYLFMCLFGNVGFMGFPVIVTIFGDSALIYAVIFNVIFNVLVYSLGIALIGGGKGGFQFQPKRLLNIPFIAAIISVLLFFAGVSLPRVLVTSLNYLGNLTTPVAMLILGATIASMPIRELFDDWRVYLFTLFRLGVIPLAVMVLLRALNISTPEITGIMIVLAAMPVATNTTMLAIEYGGNLRLASKGIFFSTILSVITIPVVAMLC
ncbi:MAG: AEC family transporter [Marvinbryantia sp.]|uniref:AEC family transporter n=3 Tax=Marvinbryantia sp. TaxID=2496532 RepID=UPI0025CF3EC5|nr:AEC family transporter [uncultured Marvinbryantia sp.]